MKRPLPFHPLLLAFFPVLSLYQHNQDQVPSAHLLRPAAMVLLAVVALWLGLRNKVPDGHKRALLVSLTAVLLLTFGHFRAIGEAITGARHIGALLIALGLWLALLAGGVWVTLASRTDLGGATRVMNVVGVAALVGPLCGLGSLLEPEVQAAAPPFAVRGKPAADPPDIYYIILDGYGRDDVLLEKYRHDNRPFTNELERRGFYVARKSCSNYMQTQLSLSSSLNLTYLDDVRKRAGGPRGRGHFSQMINRNEAAAFLRERGYRICAVGTGFDGTAVPSADLGGSSNSVVVNHFEGLLLDMTPLSLYGGLAGGMYQRHREQVTSAFEFLQNLSGRSGRPPIFAFAHVVSPHPPFVFEADGSSRNPHRAFSLNDGSHFEGSREEYRDGYAQQLKHLNRLVIRTVDRIRSSSRGPAVIILQGDHGPGAGMDMTELDKTDVRERCAILAACSLPAGGQEGRRSALYPEISPVNLFRVVFNRYHGTALPLLPDRSYYSRWTAPFDFTEVTAQARGRAAVAAQAPLSP